jgi:hypothetical protein
MVSETVHCERHGKRRATFVCSHLVGSLRTQQALGYYHAEDPGNPYPHAWCGLCDRYLFDHGGEWNDETEAFAGVKVLCSECYDEIRKINLNKPSLADALLNMGKPPKNARGKRT